MKIFIRVWTVFIKKLALFRAQVTAMVENFPAYFEIALFVFMLKTQSYYQIAIEQLWRRKQSFFVSFRGLIYFQNSEILQWKKNHHSNSALMLSWILLFVFKWGAFNDFFSPTFLNPTRKQMNDIGEKHMWIKFLKRIFLKV